MFKKFFQTKKEKERERTKALWRRAETLTSLGRPATEKELEEFRIIFEQLGVRADKMPVAKSPLVPVPKAVCTA